MHSIRHYLKTLAHYAFLFVPIPLFAQDLQLPTTYELDLQLAFTSRATLMGGQSEITGTLANTIGDEVFHRLIAVGFNQPFPWKLTLVGNNTVNASSTAGGQLYVDGGLLPIIGDQRGLWGAVLSHEVAHTGRRHQVQTYLRMLYNQRMVAYYRARVAAGDKSANWALIGFQIAAPIALKKMGRDQEHDADTQGMLLMARAGYHPDFVFALHHLLLMNSGEQSKLSAFFSDHPRWETRDQRSEKSYADALLEFNRFWPDASLSPGGGPPVVVFFTGQPQAKENKQSSTADVTVPLYCRNAQKPVDIAVLFQKDKHPVPAADPALADDKGNLIFRTKAECLEKDEAAPLLVQIPASAVIDHDRKVHAFVFVGNEGKLVGESKEFDVHFPKARK